MYDLEEPPPPERRRPARAGAQLKDPDSPASGMQLPGAVWLVVLAVVLTAVYLLMSHRVSKVEAALREARTQLEDAGASLRLLWTTTTRLDENQAARQDLLEDSIGYVKSFVEAEVARLWETAYADHERRLVQGAAGIRANDQSIRQLQDALARANTRLDALVSQNLARETDLRDVMRTATALRQTLSNISAQLAGVQDQLTASRVAESTMTGRLDGVERWVADYRTENLTARAVRDRLATLAADLRRVTIRVDSLRSRADPARAVR